MMKTTIVSSSSSHHHFFFSSFNPSSPSRVNFTWQQPTNLHLPPPSPPHPQHLSTFIAPLTQQTPHQIRRSLFTLMATSNDNGFPCAQLNNESDFKSLLTPSSSSSDRSLSICGFGSLLSERSARSTFPELTNFRVAKLNGFRRVFAHVAPIFFDRGIANPLTQEISSLSVEPCEGGSETLVVTVFEIKESEIPSFIEREHEFRFLAVVPETLEGSPYSTPAVLCGRYSDEEYFQIRCKGFLPVLDANNKTVSLLIKQMSGSKETYFERYGRYNINKIWRDDILPCRVYLRHCVLAAKNLGNEAYNNFLDHTFLGDRKTTIREYLATKGAGIMEEEPPELLKSRYGG